MKKIFIILLTVVILGCMTACDLDPTKESTGASESGALGSLPAGSEMQSSEGAQSPESSKPSDNVQSTEGAKPSDSTQTTEGTHSAETAPPATGGHSHNYTQQVTAPDCTNAGYTTNTCACGDSYRSDEKEALGHQFTNGKCTVCAEAQANYQPLNSGCWLGRAVDENNRLYELSLYFLDDLKMADCGYGAELSTLEPEFQKDLLSQPDSLVEFAGQKYYIGQGDGCEITVSGGDSDGCVEMIDSSTHAVSAKVWFRRIAGDQLEITQVEGKVFKTDCIKAGMILTWCGA